MSIELAFDQIESGHDRAIVFLHGILGRGNNLRTIAKRFIEARPGWTALLVDLRGHGKSLKSSPGPSLEAAAGDVVHLATRAALPINTIVGHSFGGKVALEAARIGAMPSLEHVVVIDSDPGSREPFRGGDGVLAVIDTIQSLRGTFSSKSDFIEAFVATRRTRDLG
jgi:pimeloyl-ACP methyl ester carboxylesterase